MTSRTDLPEMAPPSPPPGGGDADLQLEIYRQAIAHVPVAASITDVKANIVYANPAFERLTGYSVQEVIGHNESILSDKATPVEVYKELWASITSGNVWRGRLVNRRKDGSTYLADLTVVPVVDGAGDVQSFVGMHRDVTDVHRLERRVKNQDALLSSLFEAAPVIIMLVDEGGNLIFSNPAYKLLRRDMQGADVAAQFVDAFEASLNGNIKSICAQGFDFSAVEVRLDISKDESRWFACTATKVREEDLSAAGYFAKEGRSGLLFVASDVTEQRRRFEQARTNAVRALMAEQQMTQSMREVISGAIFQLQGPLNVMRAAGQMLERQGDETGLGGSITEVLNAGAEALDRLQTAMPQRPTEPVEPVNINELVRDVLDVSIQDLLREGIYVDWRPEEDLLHVPGRPNALRAAIRYLLDNAILAIKDGGTAREIVISTRSTSGGDVKIDIRDTGIGLDPQIRLKIYEPFFTDWQKTRARPGMGLVLARQIITEHGGSLELENMMTGGCRAEIVLAASNAGVSDPWEG